MLRLIFSFIVFFHGVIHLLGFAKAWDIMPVKQLSGKSLFPLSESVLKFVGIMWLLTFACFSVAAVAFLLKTEWWWLAASVALVLSQMLVFLYWKDAWAGSIVNALLLVAVVVGFASWSFQIRIRNEVRAMIEAQRSAETQVVTKEMLAGLPLPVQKWLEAANVVGKPKIQIVRLKQNGMMRSKQDGSWMSCAAEQYFTIEKPAFIWRARMQYAPFLHIAARDKYEDGKGRMLITLLSLFTIADSKGTEIDKGSMVRYLAETVWFPTAALSDYIKWEAIDSTSARATMTNGGISASGVFQFNERGDVSHFEAQRYGEFDGKYSMETWSIAMMDYRSFHGVRIPASSEVTWKLKSGNFTWFKVEITDLEFNNPAQYE
jgi:hypothetical protein